jgi:uncharacterized membrane protein YhiD involved in acid resistance
MTVLDFTLRLAVALVLGSAVGLEKIVSRLGVEPGVSTVSWRTIPTDPDEQPMISEA